MSANPDTTLPTTTPQERAELVAQALQDLTRGDTLKQIAERIGMDFRALRVWMWSAQPAQYREAQRMGILRRLGECEDSMENASSNAEVARAREVAKFNQWIAERRIPEWFAPRQEITGAGGVPLVMDLAEAARRLAFIRSHEQAIDVDALQHDSSAAGPIEHQAPQALVVSPST